MPAQYVYFHSSELGLPADIWLPLVEKQVPKAYTAGQVVYLQGSDANHFYYILNGKVKTFLADPAGSEQILTVYRDGDILGEASFFDRCPRVSSAVALVPCRIVSIDRSLVQTVFAQHPALALAMLKYLAHTVRMLSAHVNGMAFLQADRRLAQHLLSLQPDADGTLHCTHEELGFSIGASRVTVSRSIAAFAAKGWLKTGYGNITLLQRQALQRFSAQ